MVSALFSFVRTLLIVNDMYLLFVSVLLKCTGKLAQAHVAAKTTVHIFQALSNSYEEHRADLISAYSLLASILDEVKYIFIH